MARGGARAGAGRPIASKSAWSKETTDRFRELIQTRQILQRLAAFIKGEVEMQPAAVTAALGLLRKVLPDLTAVDHSGEVSIKRALELSDDELANIAASRSDGTDTPALH